MATKKVSTKTVQHETATIESGTGNLESVSCLWLDQNVNSTEDNRQTHQELRQIINYLKIFDNSDRCEEYIRQIKHEKVVLIVSGSLGRHIVPKIHPLSQLSACYVFCGDQKANEQWARDFNKVKGVVVKRADLVALIRQHQAARDKVEDGASISVIAQGSKSLEAHNAIFMWFQLFIEVLLRMHHKSADRKELIDLCKKNYSGNDKEMTIIKEFERTYKSDQAISWYTREACFYRMMNKALRVQDYDVLFALRFFITDIAKQLKEEYEKFIRTSDTRNMIRVYRGQAIGMDELRLMKDSIGEYLSMNSFLSTSRQKSTAMQFIHKLPVNDEYLRLLFEIEIDPRLKTTAFADIKYLSYHGHEDEVLIMLGALFRIQSVVQDKSNKMWVATISLASEDDYHLRETFGYMKEKIGDDTNLDSLGKILIEMGQYEQAEKCYARLLEEEYGILGGAHIGAGRAQLGTKTYDKSREHFEEALQILKRASVEDDARLADCLYGIGVGHWKQNNYDNALVRFEEAAQMYEMASVVDPRDLGKCYNALALTCSHTGQDDLALEYYTKTLEIQQANLPADHPDIALTFNNLGTFHEDQVDLATALEYYEKSLTIYRKILPPTHEELIRTEKNVKRLRENMEN